ncbi:MAG: helix-turn-helix domain-containing protein [Gammaproteobacteria bacterium]|nr:helix-turn-helix domain-containing protein [Gammaproteobacteria bacterium]
MGDRKLFDTKAAAAECGLSRSTFLRYVKAGRIAPGIKMGPRAIRWHIDDLNAYLERCRARPSPKAA